MSTCDAVRDALIDGISVDAYATHLAGCPACQGLTTMTRSIDDELRETPQTAGQRPQWIAELYARRAHRRRQTLLVTGWLAAVCFVGVVAYGVTRAELWRPQSRAATPITPGVSPPHVTTVPPPPTPPRPAWVTSMVPFTGSCTDTGGAKLSCVGVSSYLASKDAGRDEARDVALEALSLELAKRLQLRFFTEQEQRIYEPAMRAQLDAYTRSPEDDTGVVGNAYRTLADSRRRAARALSDAIGAALPPRESDLYWEEYAAPGGTGTQVLVVVRYELDADAIGTMIDVFDSPVRVHPAGPGRVRAFPLLAFAFPEFRGGFISMKEPIGLNSLIE